MPSSFLKSSVWPLPSTGTSMGMICEVKYPFSVGSWARWWLRTPNSSICRREATGACDVAYARLNEVRGEMNRLLARATLTVDSGRRGRDREARGEPRIARDVQRLLAGLAHAAEDHVLDLLRFDARAIDDLFQHERAEDDGMDLLELAVAATNRRSHGLDDHYFTHINVSLPTLCCRFYDRP